MNAWQKLRLALAVLAVLVGALFLLTAGYYAFRFVTQVESPLRRENLVGIGLCLLYAFTPLTLSALLAATLRDVISKRLYWFLILPVLVAVLAWILMRV